MKHFIIVVLLIAVVGCQNFDNGALAEPEDLALGEIQITSLSNDLIIYRLTETDREFLQTNLKRNGYSLSADEFSVYCKMVEVTIQTLQALLTEMPQSLREATVPWGEIVEHDSDAAAFVQKLEGRILENLAAIDVPSSHPCFPGSGKSLSSCFNSFALVCKYFGLGTCISLGSILELLHCIGNCYPEPHTHYP